jgi:signal transduction histidine kinase
LNVVLNQFVISWIALHGAALVEGWWPALLAVTVVASVVWWAGVDRGRKARTDQAAQDALWQTFVDSQEQERRRIAGDLHDGLGQNILIIRNRALLGLEQSAHPQMVAEQFNEILKTTSLALEEVRHIVHNLSTHQLTQLGLTQAVDAMIDRIAAPAGLRVERRLEPVDELFSSESAVLFYRIAQEALNNVIKHANASLARVRLVVDVHHLEFTVEDDGRGFDANGRPPEANSIGLMEMQRRARLLGGDLHVESLPAQGTRLRVIVPLKDGGRI